MEEISTWCLCKHTCILLWLIACKELIYALRRPFSSFCCHACVETTDIYVYIKKEREYQQIDILWSFERDNICLLLQSQKEKDDQHECCTGEIKQPLHTMWHNAGVPIHQTKAQLSSSIWRRDNLVNDSCVRNLNGGDRIYLFFFIMKQRW